MWVRERLVFSVLAFVICESVLLFMYLTPFLSFDSAFPPFTSYRFLSLSHVGYFFLSLSSFLSVILFITSWLLHEHISAFQETNIWCRHLAAYKKGECSLVRRDYSGQLRTTKKKKNTTFLWKCLCIKAPQEQRNLNCQAGIRELLRNDYTK